MEVLVGEVDKRNAVLFGGHSVGVINAKKALEWQHVADNVNAVASEGQSVAEVKKKSDIKVEAKKCLASHRQSAVPRAGERASQNSPPWIKNWRGSSGNPS